MSNSFYLNCDKLENLPALNRENWLFELDLQCKILPQGSSLLQIGSMDATRIIEILKVRPDLKVTGLEIEKDFVGLARKNLKDAGLDAQIIEADVTTFRTADRYDYVTCLNNTLGYIPETDKAIQSMKNAASSGVFVSVYGERFNEPRAREYFNSLGIDLESAEEGFFHLKDFGTVKRFTRNDVVGWGGEVMDTPLGYFSIMKP